MSFSKKEKSIIESALAQWKTTGLIEENKAKELSDSLPTKDFDWKSLAYYSSLFALLSLIIAVLSIFADEALLRLIDSLIESSYLTKTIISILISSIFYFLDIRFSNKDVLRKKYSQEVYALLAAISLAISIGFISFLTGLEERPGLLILALGLLYLTIGMYQQKSVYWFFGIAALYFSFGAITLQFESNNDTFLGMNYSLRFTLFSGILVNLSYLLRKWMNPFYEYTYNTSIIVFFTSLWILSITGNHNSYIEWLEIRQYELWVYSLLLFIVSGLATVVGLKKEDSWLKNTGIIFIFFNIYTRYFEYLWDSMHKALFFLILAVSFWLIGKKAEKLWSKQN